MRVNIIPWRHVAQGQPMIISYSLTTDFMYMLHAPGRQARFIQAYKVAPAHVANNPEQVISARL